MSDLSDVDIIRANIWCVGTYILATVCIVGAFATTGYSLIGGLILYIFGVLFLSTGFGISSEGYNRTLWKKLGMDLEPGEWE